MKISADATRPSKHPSLGLINILADAGPAGQMVRSLVPWTIVLTTLMEIGRHQGFYTSGSLIAIANSAILTALICWKGRWLLKSDVVRRRKELDLERRASVDYVTGLANRAVFIDCLHRRIEKNKRSGGPHFAVLYIDLDNFKSVNDQLGHHVGDCLLAEVAATINRTIRSCDLVSRIGGDEFAVLLDEISSSNDAEVIASRIVGAFSESITVRDHSIQVGLSVGVATYHDHHNTPEDLLIDADAGLYQAKMLGKSRYAVANCKDGTVWLDC